MVSVLPIWRKLLPRWFLVLMLFVLLVYFFMQFVRSPASMATLNQINCMKLSDSPLVTAAAMFPPVSPQGTK